MNMFELMLKNIASHGDVFFTSPNRLAMLIAQKTGQAPSSILEQMHVSFIPNYNRLKLTCRKTCNEAVTSESILKSLL